MCLKKVTDNAPNPDAEGIGYKIIYQWAKKTSFYRGDAYNDGNNISRGDDLIAADDSAYYYIGFHVFDTLEDAKAHLGIYNHYSVQIWKVRCKGFLARGIEDHVLGCLEDKEQSVSVWKEMEFLEMAYVP